LSAQTDLLKINGIQSKTNFYNYAVHNKNSNNVILHNVYFLGDETDGLNQTGQGSEITPQSNKPELNLNQLSFWSKWQNKW